MREYLEKIEAKALAGYAIKSGETKGRKHKEPKDKYRLCFQKDINRIVHCKAFRRLDEKTQVFLAGSGDHYRTRLTHTLEVAQVSRDLARRLRLNEDLCEAIALAHDLGHSPFGHGGESVLNEIMQNFGMSFEHNEQSRRVVEVLEQAYPDFDGINLSMEVLDGMIKHQTAYDQAGKVFEFSAHLEAQIVNIADEIAYTNHDIDDGIRSGILTVKQMRKLCLWQTAEAEMQKKYGTPKDERVFMSRMISAIITMMIEDLCQQTEKNLKKFKVRTVADVKNFNGTLACFSPKMIEMCMEMRQFLYNTFYLSETVMGKIRDGKRKIKKLFEYYLKNPEKFPKASDIKKESELDRIVAIKDYIAGMTDRFLEQEFKKIKF